MTPTSMKQSQNTNTCLLNSTLHGSKYPLDKIKKIFFSKVNQDIQHAFFSEYCEEIAPMYAKAAEIIAA